MAIQLLIKRFTTSAAAEAYTGPAGQLVLDLESKRVRVHDGLTVGGTLVGLAEAAVQALIDNALAGLTVGSIDGLQAALDGKASNEDLTSLQTALQAAIDGKADQAALDTLATEVAGKANQADVDTALASKADQAVVDTLQGAVDGKANQADVDTALAAKADQAALDTLAGEVDGKADGAALTALQGTVAAKADKTYVDTELAKKVASTDLFDEGSSLIRSELLPSYVDDVLEFATRDDFPAAASEAEGDGGAEKGKIYVATDTNKIYRWSGSVYIDLASPETVAIASDAQAVAMAENDVALSPLNMAAILAEIGFTKDAEGNWVLDEGEVSGGV